MNKTGTTGTYGTLVENQAKMDAWLDKFRNCGNVRLSCEAVGIGRTTVYRWRRRWATFAAAWDEAQEDATDILEATAWKRAVDEASDRLLMFLLKAHRPERFKERVETQLTGKDGAPIVLTFTGNVNPEDL